MNRLLVLDVLVILCYGISAVLLCMASKIVLAVLFTFLAGLWVYIAFLHYQMTKFVPPEAEEKTDV